MSTNSEQNLINDAISFISNTSARSSVTNEMVGRVLAFLNTKCSTLAASIDEEMTTRADDVQGLETQIENIGERTLAWRGTQAQYNALAAKDTNRMYVINDSLATDEAVAVYLGTQLLWAEPNMVGEFLEDTTKDDWYWFPEGVKTALPVDPATKRFSFYYPTELMSGQHLFGESISSTFVCRLKKLERIPLVAKNATKSLYYMLSRTNQCDILPLIDLRNIKVGNTQYEAGYLVLSNTAVKQIHFANTEGVRKWEMTINLTQLLAVTGVDLSAAVTLLSKPFGGKTAYIELKNLGKAQTAANFDLRSDNWGDDTKFPRSHQSLVDSLLTNSFDRAAAGYISLTIQLSAATYARLTSSEVSAITAKGYTLVTA